ncbi:uncharacterized protein LOC125759472 [Rhipicephalus sanguineus]|uniref:uncharacterized protein LOC125759472 n=1 Tax=Rhipicephalus sanguineus TaxID=34632 RepID=UPI0020C2E0A5|nr:uncharacterized protein LOC125759472 [Rhipicephalus sanguineus]
MHLSAIVTSTVRITSNEMASDFLKRVYSGLPANTKFYVICLLSLQEYLQHLFPLINQHWTHMIYSYWIVLGNGSNFARLIVQQKPCTFYFMTATEEGYVLLGPSYARRNNCSGLLTIAQAPNTDGVTGLTHTYPAKEERSGVLRLSCILSEYERKNRGTCYTSVRHVHFVLWLMMMNKYG